MKNKNRSIFALALVLALIAISIDSRAAAPRYHLIDLGSLGGGQFNDSFSGVHGRLINNAGTVVGGMDTADADPFGWANHGLTAHTFEWKNGSLSDLGATAFDNKTNFSQAFWINNSGHSVGMATYNASIPTTPLFKAVLWKDRQMLDLGALGGDQSYAHSINNHDQAVGWALDTVATSEKIWWDYPYPFGTQQRAALYEGGSVRDLGTLGGPQAQALFINDAGQIVGQSFTTNATGAPKSNGDWHWSRPVAGFIWQNGAMTNLGSLGGTWVLPRRLNERGQVVGFAMRKGDSISRPFLWDQGVMKDLGTLGGSSGSANDINNAGEIVGGTEISGGGFHPFLWRKGVMKDLGSIRERSQAWYINSKSQVVGTTGGDLESSYRAFFWEEGGPAVDLNTLIPKGSPMVLRYPVGINDAGEIVGYGVLNNGDSHPFLLVPLPRLTVRAYPDIEDGHTSLALDLKVSAGRRYALESSPDLITWSPRGESFIAQADSLTFRFDPLDAHLFLRVVVAL